MSDIVAVETAEVAALAVARAYAGSAMAANTLKAYGACWRHFVAWCARTGVVPMPADPKHVAAYIASCAETHVRNSLNCRTSAIAWYHKINGCEYDARASVIRETMRGVMRAHGRPPKQAAAIETDVVRKLVATCDDSAFGLRDRAMLLLTFAGALRRSEVVALDVRDVSFEAGGMRLLLRSAKGDPDRSGQSIGIVRGLDEKTCAVAAVRAWIARQGCASGPLFRRLSHAGRVYGDKPMLGSVVARLLRDRAALAGITGELLPHGLRAGFVTVAYAAGARDDDIMRHTRHKSVEVMRRYIRKAGLVSESPTSLLGL